MLFCVECTETRIRTCVSRHYECLMVVHGVIIDSMERYLEHCMEAEDSWIPGQTVIACRRRAWSYTFSLTGHAQGPTWLVILRSVLKPTGFRILTLWTSQKSTGPPDLLITKLAGHPGNTGRHQRTDSKFDPCKRIIEWMINSNKWVICCDRLELLLSIDREV